jgi:hypothetical protein
VADLADGVEHWPTYCAHAAWIGIRAVVSIPMRVDGSSIGVVDLYDSSIRA